jgi:hypothetical protein
MGIAHSFTAGTEWGRLCCPFCSKFPPGRIIDTAATLTHTFFPSLTPPKAGLIAESVCCVIYVPVDVVKERMQVQRSTDQSLKGHAYKNSWHALKHITKTEGMSGIYKGTQLSSFQVLIALLLFAGCTLTTLHLLLCLF